MNRIRNILGFIGFILLTNLVMAAPIEQKTQCLDSKKAADVVSRYRWISEGRSLEFFPCNTEDLFTKTVSALIDIESLPATEARTDEFNQNAYGPSPIQYIKDRVEKFIFETDTSSACKNKGYLAYVYSGESFVHICPVANKLSKLSLMAVIIHETRHIDGFGHVYCDRGPYKNIEIGACDETYEERGSYGVGAEFNVRVSRTSVLDAAIRSEARASAVADYLIRFNKLPLNLKDGVFAQTKDQKLYFAAGDDLVPLTNQAPMGILVNRHGLPTWYDKTKPSVLSFDLINNIINADGSFAKDYKEKWSPSLGSSLVDVMYGGSYLCKLYTRVMECSDGTVSDDKVIKFDFNVDTKGFLYLRDLIFIKLADDTIYILPSTLDELRLSKVMNWRKIDKPLYFSSLVTYSNNDGYAVGDDGFLRLIKLDKPKHESTKINNTILFNKVVGPTIWSPKLNEL